MAKLTAKWITAVMVKFSVLSLAVGQVSTPPSAVSAVVGDSPLLTCVYNGTNPFEWRQYVTSEAGVSIFQKPPNAQPSDPKYNIRDTYNLVVNDVNLWDGGAYGCKDFSMPSFAKADLVVLEPPKLVVPDKILEGVATVATCTARYGGPSEIIQQQLPRLQMYLNNVPLAQVQMRTPGESGTEDDYEPGKLTATANVTASDEHNGCNFTCVISTQRPLASVSTTTTLNVRYSVRKIEVYPTNSFYYVGEQINCTAEGNPSPRFQWRPVSSSLSRVYDSSVLPITADMLGQNEWKCLAMNNVVSAATIEIFSYIKFEVLPSGSGKPEIPTATSGVDRANPAQGILTLLCLSLPLCMSYSTCA